MFTIIETKAAFEKRCLKLKSDGSLPCGHGRRESQVKRLAGVSIEGLCRLEDSDCTK